MEGQPSGRSPVNVTEAYALYDTAQIGPELALPRGYPSYDSLAALEEVPFFNVRNRGEVGLAYTNKESKDALPFVYYLYSLGVRFKAFPCYHEIPPGPAGGDPTPEDVAMFNSDRLFDVELPYHVGLILKIREDEKLAHTVELAPPGSGIFGHTTGAVVQNIQNHNQGWPDLANRWQFPEPIAIPRNAVVTVSLRISEYGKYLLQHMVGPKADLPLYDTVAAKEFLAKRVSLIRVSMFGRREVQQRGELHY